MTTKAQFNYIIHTAVQHYRQGNPYFLDRFKDESVARIERKIKGPGASIFTIHTKCGQVLELIVYVDTTYLPQVLA